MSNNTVVLSDGRYDTAASSYLASSQLINLDRGKKKERGSQPISCHTPRQPRSHSGAPVLTTARGLVLWSVRTDDCYSRFDPADAETKDKSRLMDMSIRGGGKKANYSPLHSFLNFLPQVVNGD